MLCIARQLRLAAIVILLGLMRVSSLMQFNRSAASVTRENKFLTDVRLLNVVIDIIGIECQE